MNAKRKPKPVKAWALYSNKGIVRSDYIKDPLIYGTKAAAANDAKEGERIARVEIREVGR